MGYEEEASELQSMTPAPLFKLDRESSSLTSTSTPVRGALATSLAADAGEVILAEGVETREEMDVVRRLGLRDA